MKQILTLMLALFVAIAAFAQSAETTEQISSSRVQENPVQEPSLTLAELRDMSNRMDHQEFIEMALRHDSLLKATSTREWLQLLRITNEDSITLACLPTLYDLVVSNRIYKVSGEEAIVLRQEWERFHANDLNILARAYAYSTFPTYQHLKLYRSLPDCWERGLLLHADPGTSVHREALPLLEDYIAKYPNSPLIGPIRARLDKILQMEVHSTVESRFTSADSIRICFNTTNAHKVVFRLCKAGKMNTRRYGSLAYLHLPILDSCEVTISSPIRPFSQEDIMCALAPQKLGSYIVYAVLPEDTMGIEMARYSSRSYHSFTVSDLCIFDYIEPTMARTRGRCHVVACDALTGLPVRGASIHGSCAIGWNTDAYPFRLTNKQGHASYRFGKRTYENFLMAKKRSYGTALDNTRIYHHTVHNDLHTYANARIFRPGDTLRLSTLCTYGSIDERRVEEGAEIKFQIRDPRNKAVLDTAVNCEPHAGAANLVFPIPANSMLGNYRIEIRGYKFGISFPTRDYFYFHVEDYRLPTFELCLSPENRVMDISDSVFCIRGAAMQFSGLPLANQMVEGVLTYDLKYFPFTCQTSFNGSFCYQIPDSIAQLFEEDEHLFVDVHLTSADGETHEAQQYVCIEGKKSKLESQKPKKENRTLFDLWPADEQLWAPSDSLIYNADGTVSVLLGVRGYETDKTLRTRSVNPVYVIVSSRKRLISEEWKVLHAGLNRLSFTLPTDTNEYLDIRFVTTLMGEVHNTSVHAVAPLQTELHLVPVSFRNYLIPGVEEEWQFRLQDQQGNPVTGRLLCTMLDEAVNNLEPIYFQSLPSAWNKPFIQFSTPYRFSSYNHLRTRLPKRQKFVLDKLPLFEPYRAPGDTTLLVMVSGLVVDEKGEPVIGASIQVQGSQNGTITDYDGRFSITAPATANLVLSYIGMEQVTIPVRSRVHVILQASTDVLEEVVVTGYGGQPGANANIRIRGVGSVQDSFSGSELSKALAGEVAGMAIKSAPLYELEAVEEEAIETTSTGHVPMPSSVEDALNQVVTREGDTRLAFYIPGIESDSTGLIRYAFRAPLDNTQWHLQGMAWTKNGASCTIDTLITARRTLMAHLTVPRFLRQGDQVVLSCIVRNSSDTLRHATVSAQLLLPGSDSVLYTSLVDTIVPPSEELLLLMPCEALSMTDSLVARLRVVGRDGASDGEQRILPVLPIIEPVVESVPFYCHPSDTALTVSLPSVPQDAGDASLILSYCANPLAYLFNGLPTVEDTTFVTPLPLAHYLFTLSVFNYLANRYPGYRKPADIQAQIKALRKFQRIDGGISWLADSRSWSSSYITLEFLYLMGELSQIAPLPDDLHRITSRAIRYLDRTYSDRIKLTEELAAKHHSTVNYAIYSPYAMVRSYFPQEDFHSDAQRCYKLILDTMSQSSNLIQAPYQALCLERAGRHSDALHLIAYLRNRAVNSRELGMYFNNLPKYYLWFSTKEQQATYLRAFAAVDPIQEEVDALRQWLLLSRQTTRWGKSSLSAYVSSALILSGSNWLAPATSVDSTNLAALTIDTIPFTDSYEDERFRIRNGQLTIRTSQTAHPAWGSATLTYSVPVTSVRPFVQPAIALTRTYSIVRDDKVMPISESTVLEKGDRIRVSLTIKTDREMDGLVLRDNKPATLEPVAGNSGFLWVNVDAPADKPRKRTSAYDEYSSCYSYFPWMSGVLSYQQFLSESVLIYIEHLPRGTYTHTYDCYVTTIGTTISGLATATSELAPEFSSHTGAQSFNVE